MRFNISAASVELFARYHMVIQIFWELTSPSPFFPSIFDCKKLRNTPPFRVSVSPSHLPKQHRTYLMTQPRRLAKLVTHSMERSFIVQITQKVLKSS